MDLDITVVRFVFSALEDIHLPEHPGSAIRGALGEGLYNVVCSLKGQQCKVCDNKYKCPYSLLFEPFLTEKEKEETSKRFYNKPRPFVIEAERKSGFYTTGEELSFKIILFGKIRKFLPYIIEAWWYIANIGLGNTRGAFKVKEIWLENDIKGKAERIYIEHENIVRNVNLHITKKDINNYCDIFNDKKIMLRFISPTLMKYKGNYVKDVTFNFFMRNLFRRLSSLSYFYGGERLNIDFGNYLYQAEKKVQVKRKNMDWERWYRYSSRQKQKIEMQGLVGKVGFEGKLKDFIPYLLYGQYTHVGKNTVFGQGEYEVVQ